MSCPHSPLAAVTEDTGTRSAIHRTALGLSPRHSAALSDFSSEGYFAANVFHSDCARSLLLKAPSCTKCPCSGAVVATFVARLGREPWPAPLLRPPSARGAGSRSRGHGSRQRRNLLLVPVCAKFSMRMRASCDPFAVGMLRHELLVGVARIGGGRGLPVAILGQRLHARLRPVSALALLGCCCRNC